MEDDITAYLDALRRDECYRVERVLKEAPHEVTEVVWFSGANDAQLGPFVRKRIRRDASLGSAYVKLREAQRAGRRFRHLPRIEDCYERDDELVVVMEFVRGETLHEAVYRRDPSPQLAREVFPPLCDAVIELHEGFDPPLIHRDLKPTNAILSDAGLTLIDFGIAREYREGAEGDTTTFGTRAYAPPEQFGYGQTDVRSDVYALGMMLYYLLTEEVPSPRLAGGAFDLPAVPPPLRPVLARATAFDPAARYPSVRALREAFDAACVSADAAADARAAANQPVPWGAVPPVTTPPAPAPIANPPVPWDMARPAPQQPGAAQPTPVSSGALPWTPQPASASQTPPPPSSRAGAVAHTAGGIIRNVAVIAVWVLFLIATVGIVIDPGEESMAAYPPHLRWMGGVSVQLIITACAYPLLDRACLARRLGRPSLPNPVTTAIVLVVAGFVVFGVMMALNGDFSAR